MNMPKQKEATMLSFRLPKKLKMKLRIEAAKAEISCGDFIRKIINQYLEVKK